MKFSPTTLGFYSPGVHGDNIPEDAVEVSSARYAEVMEQHALGLRIVAGPDGGPVAVDQPSPEPLDRAAIEAARLVAYADPLTGSDRYFAEAQRESLLGNAEAADAAKALGMARFVAIQAEFPWPAE